MSELFSIGKASRWFCMNYYTYQMQVRSANLTTTAVMFLWYRLIAQLSKIFNRCSLKEGSLVLLPYHYPGRNLFWVFPFIIKGHTPLLYINQSLSFCIVDSTPYLNRMSICLFNDFISHYLLCSTSLTGILFFMEETFISQSLSELYINKRKM